MEAIMRARALLLAGLLAMTGAVGMAQNAAPPPSDDPFTWLEEIRGERALAWARAENARTLGDLQSDPRYQANYDRALEIVQARDRIPAVSMRPDGLYNFWQDAEHVQGILRRTSLASYRTDSPQWETVLDVDALARAEGKTWVYQGMECLPPEDGFGLVISATAAATRMLCASSTCASASSSRAASTCPRASRTLPGRMPTRSS